MLNVFHVTKQYHKVIANNDITFDINDGEIGILLGPNGDMYRKYRHFILILL